MSLSKELSARHEMADGSGPKGANFDDKLAAKRPLSAFTLLEGGDVFEDLRGKPPPQGPARAQAYLKARVTLNAHGARPELCAKVLGDMERLVRGNLELVARLEVAKPLRVELVPVGHTMAQYGFPESARSDAIGLFWDQPGWGEARMALLQSKLPEVPQLTVHEMGHAIHFLAFTQGERDLIYRLLLRTFHTRSAVDEAFAIYTEREFLETFTEEDKRAPDVYGFTRQRWNEDHVFTRFVRNLYFPYKPLAGPKLGGSARRGPIQL